MDYTPFLVSVHERYALYSGRIPFPECFIERLTEQRPELIQRLHQTGRKVCKRNGRTEITLEIWDFIRDVW